MSVYIKTLTPTLVFDNPFHAIFTENLRMSNNLKYLRHSCCALHEFLQIITNNSRIDTTDEIVSNSSNSMMEAIKI